MITAEEKYIRVSTLQEALAAAADHKEHTKFLAGGTDMMVNRYQGNEASTVFIDITGISALKSIKEEQGQLRIGALVTLHELEKHPLIKRLIPALGEAAHAVGSPLIRKTATIVGNVLCENRCLYYNQSEWWREAVGYCLKCKGDICIATGGANACFSEFVSDTAPVLISYEAEIRVFGKEGKERLVKLKDIYTGDGVKPRSLKSYELVTELIIPLQPARRCVFKKLRLRESLEFTSLSTAVSVTSDKKINMVLAGMDPKPVYIEPVAEESMDEMVKRIQKRCRAVDNDVFSRNYRRDMIKVFIVNSYKELGLL